MWHIPGPQEAILCNINSVNNWCLSSVVGSTNFCKNNKNLDLLLSFRAHMSVKPFKPVYLFLLYDNIMACKVFVMWFCYCLQLINGCFCLSQKYQNKIFLYWFHFVSDITFTTLFLLVLHLQRYFFFSPIDFARTVEFTKNVFFEDRKVIVRVKLL